MNKYSQFLDTNKFKYLFAITLFLITVAYGIVKDQERTIALKNNDLVEATIVDITPSRSCREIHVEYFYKGKTIENVFSAEEDTFNVKEKILLKVSKKYPDEFIAFVRKVQKR